MAVSSTKYVFTSAFVCVMSVFVCSFVGTVLAGINSGLTYDLSIKAGLNAAYLSLQSTTAVSSELNPELLKEENIRTWAPWVARTIAV